MKYVSFLVDDACRPGAVIDLMGTILHVNQSFRDCFCGKENGNIKELLTIRSADSWNGRIGHVDCDDKETFEIDIQFPLGQIAPAKVDIMHLGEKNQVVALFDIPKSYQDRAEKKYRWAFNTADSFMVFMNRKGIICDVNDQHTKFFNVSKDYFLGKSAKVFSLLIQEEKEFLTNHIKKAKLYGYAENTLRYEPSFDDERQYQMTTVYDSETQMFLIRINDWTEKMALEKRLAHSGSLSTIGELAASIAHEIKNPMTTLKGFVQLLKISTSDETTKYLAVIDDEISRMESILGEMLVLSKPSSNKKTTFSLEVLVDDMLQVMRPKALLEGITINPKESELDETLISGDAEKIKQVLLNLFKNALEAMSAGGVLTTELDLDSDGQYRLQISDTGKGMNLQQLDQVFMPFYTSKAEGTGLGLPFVLKTVEEHGGSITVESEVDQGTTFIVTFPPAIAHIQQENLPKKKLLLF